jgi:septal ring-binding cell division protein DamX
MTVPKSTSITACRTGLAVLEGNVFTPAEMTVLRRKYPSAFASGRKRAATPAKTATSTTKTATAAKPAATPAAKPRKSTAIDLTKWHRDFANALNRHTAQRAAHEDPQLVARFGSSLVATFHRRFSSAVAGK